MKKGALVYRLYSAAQPCVHRMRFYSNEASQIHPQGLMFIPESSEMASTLMKNGQTSLILTFEAISLMRLGSGYMSPAWNMGIVMAI